MWGEVEKSVEDGDDAETCTNMEESAFLVAGHKQASWVVALSYVLN
jgi:hypothetical protein